VFRNVGIKNSDAGELSQTFSRINIPTFSNLVILHTYLPMKMEQTVFRNVGIKNSDAGELSQTFSRINIPTFWNLVILHTYPPMKMEQSVPKRRHMEFRRRGITQNKAHNIQNTEKFWNQEYSTLHAYSAAIIFFFLIFPTAELSANDHPWSIVCQWSFFPHSDTKCSHFLGDKLKLFQCFRRKTCGHKLMFAPFLGLLS